MGERLVESVADQESEPNSGAPSTDDPVPACAASPDGAVHLRQRADVPRLEPYGSRPDRHGSRRHAAPARTPAGMGTSSSWDSRSSHWVPSWRRRACASGGRTSAPCGGVTRCRGRGAAARAHHRHRGHRGDRGGDRRLRRPSRCTTSPGPPDAGPRRRSGPFSPGIAPVWPSWCAWRCCCATLADYRALITRSRWR